MSGAPLVSVVVCTRDRPEPLERALRSVRGQTFRDFELVVVDDGSDPPAAEPGDCRLVRLAGGGVGAARAGGLEAAHGRYVAWCDDDDEWLPRHLEVLAGALEADPGLALVYGDSEWAEGGEVPYSIDYDALILREDNHIFPSDTVVRTERARAAGGFDPTLEAAEDWDLWLRMSRTDQLRHVPEVLARRHEGPGSVYASGRWEERHRVFEAHAEWLRAAGPAADHDLLVDAAPRRAFDRSTWSPPRRELVWHSILRPHQSFGAVARRLLPALERAGVTPVLAPTRTQLGPELARFQRPLDHWGRFGFYYDYRQCPSVLPVARTVNYTMWESTGVPEAMVAEINSAVELQYVPSVAVSEALREAGVEVPIRVLHHGVDAEQFPVQERPERETFTFGTLGELTHRKGFDVLVSAFEQEFGPDEPARLLLRSSRPVEGFETTHPSIELQTGFVPDAALAAILGEMDAFALPSRGEGFGLLGLEAMATGLPVIATNWSGPAEYLDDSDSLPLDYELVDISGVRSNNTVYDGRWAEPDVDHLRRLMRRLFADRAEARAMGARAAERVRRDWTWDRPARQIRDDLDELA